MKALHNFLSSHKHLYKILILLPLLIWFKYLEVSVEPVFLMHSTLDDKIPFLKFFILPYLIWFPYIAFGLIYTGIHCAKDFNRLLLFLGAGMTIAYLIYSVFPNAQDLRPVITQQDMLSRTIAFIYTTDTPTNVCPSIHVINSIAVDSALRRSKAFSKIKYGKPASLVLTILICLSTMFIKQHSILDVAYGILTAGVLYLMIYIIPETKIMLTLKQSLSLRLRGAGDHES
ncbi:MAG TPA: phosphatase [Clostridiales bacterium]|nr:phosphatase [Clostridiales bacterium]